MAAAPAMAQPRPCHGAPTPYRLLIVTESLRNDHGYLVANLYGTDRRRWLADNGWLAVWRDPAQRGPQLFCLYLPAPGRYAVVMFHDANGNGVLDQGPLGIPTEGFGFSNNVIPLLMAPSLSSALFTAGPGDTRISIRLHYPPIP